MEIFNRERNSRDGDDDEEAFGAFGDQSAKKQEFTPPPPPPDQNTYHPLHHGAGGEFTLRNRPNIIGKWLEAPYGAPENSESDDEDDEEAEKEKQPDQQAAESTQYVESPPEHHTETPASVAQAAPAPMAYEPTPVSHPTQESLSTDGEQPDWLVQDKQQFEQIMQHEASADFVKAASGELLTDTESGRPAAIENAVNESEPVHPVSGYRVEQEQQFQGYAPGPDRTRESAWPPSPPTEHTPQPAWANQSTTPVSEFRPQEQSPSVPYTPTIIRPNSIDTRRAEQVGLRRGLIAGFVTGYALKGFLASRKLKREQRQQKEEIEKQQEATAQHTMQQQAMSQQITRQNEQIAGLQAQQAPERYAPPATVMQPQPESRLQQPAYTPSAEYRPAPSAATEGPLQPAVERRPQTSAPVPEAAPSNVSAERPRVEMPAAVPVGMKTESTPDTKTEIDEAKAAADHEAAARRAVEEAREAEAAAAQENQQRVEQDAWLRHVLDKEGHEVQGAVHYGREYAQERAHETKGSDSAAVSPPPGGVKTSQRHKAAGTTAFFGRTPVSGGGQQTPPQYTPPAQPTYGQDYRQAIDSGLTPPDHSLPAGMPRPADWQRQLAAKKQSTFVSALTSPWLFLMLSLILLAYFIATLL